MKNFADVVLVVLFLAALAAPAQTATELTIQVLEAESSAPVAGAQIAIGEATCTTDFRGRCQIAAPAGASRLDVRAEGYAEQSLEADPAATKPIEIRLIARSRFREQIDVVAPGDAPLPGPAQIPVKPADVVGVAGGAENIFHLLQTLPGVASPEEFSGRLSVRGGGPDENLTVMDGVEIHNPYRLFGLVSAFNPETVESFNLSAGAFDARHGDRLSSLLLIGSRSGTTEHAITGSGALSVTDTNVITEGRTPVGTGSWLLAARRTYYDLVAERFTEQDLPSFTDLQGKTHWSLGQGRTLTFFGLRSRESADASFEDAKAGESGAFLSRTRNDVLSATFHSPIGSRVSSRTIGASYVNTEAVDFDGDLRNTGRRSNAPGDGVGAFGTSRVEVTWESRVRDASLRQEFSWQLDPRHTLEAGGELHRLDTRIRFLIPGDSNPSEANPSSLAGGAGLPKDLDSERRYTRLGAWLQARSHLSNRLLVEPGVRVDRSGANARTSVSPRLASTLVLGSAMRLRAAAGLYTQSAGYEKLVQSDYFMDLSGSGPLDLDNERSRHALLGLERDLAPGLLARAEVYYKHFDRLVVGRLETPDETEARLAEYDFPPALAAELPSDPWITTVPANAARGRSYGFDLYLSRKASPDARLHGWASYTFGVARREAYGRDYPFDYDRRHALSVVANLRLGRKLELSTTTRLSSGFPRTPIVGLRVAATRDVLDADRDGNRAELIPERDAEGRLVYATDLGGISNLNTARLPMYARVDARLTYSPGGPKGRIKLYLDIINVLARENAGLLEPELLYDPDSDRPRIVEERTASIPFLPSFGIHIDLARRRGPTPRVVSAPTPPLVRPGGGWALSARPASTLGPGLEVTRSLLSRVNLRLAYGVPLETTIDETASNTDYEVEVQTGGMQAALDWFPFGGRFRASLGLLRTSHGFIIHSKDTPGLEVGGHLYANDELAQIAGSARVDRWAPYYGLGWGNAVGPNKRYGLVIDVGVAHQGQPVVTLGGNGTATTAAVFRERLAVETRDLAERLKGWSVYPVVSIGVSRRF